MLFSASVLSICRNEQAGGFIIFYWQILPLFWGYEYMLRSVTVVYYKAFSCCTIIADLVLLLQVAQRQNICNANGMMPHSAKALEIALHSHRTLASITMQSHMRPHINYIGKRLHVRELVYNCKILSSCQVWLPVLVRCITLNLV